MGNCARWSSYLQKVTALVVGVVNTVLLKGTTDMPLPAIGNGVGHQKSRSEKKCAHNTSSSTSMDVARL